MDLKTKIDEAVAAHAQWKNRLRTAIDTGASDFKVESVMADNLCQFGQWLYSLPETEKQSENFKIVKDYHAQFHKLAAKILNLALTGKKAEAAKSLDFGGEYSKVSGSLVMALTEWGRKRG